MAEKKSATYLKWSQFYEQTSTNKEKLVKLHETQPLDQFNEEVRDMIAPLYDLTDANKKRTGSILNAIYTQNTTVFMLSWRILCDLVATDTERHGLKSCTPKDYKAILHWFLGNKILEIIREQKGQRAALFRLTHPAYVDLLYRSAGKDVVDAHDDYNLSWYDKTNGGTTSSNELTEQERQYMAGVKERARKKREDS